MVAQLNHTIVAARDFGITSWPNPWRGNEGQINHNDGGRGLYFEDPSGHYLEVRPARMAAGNELVTHNSSLGDCRR